MIITDFIAKHTVLSGIIIVALFLLVKFFILPKLEKDKSFKKFTKDFSNIGEELQKATDEVSKSTEEITNKHHLFHLLYLI